MSERLVAALGGARAGIDGYGKAAIAAKAGELEDGALWHVPGGYAMREVLGDTKAIVPSTKKVGGLPAAAIDVPIHPTSTPPTSAATTTPWRVRVAGPAPAAEIVLILVMSAASARLTPASAACGQTRLRSSTGSARVRRR